VRVLDLVGVIAPVERLRWQGLVLSQMGKNTHS
jgi:hypothetical protein